MHPFTTQNRCLFQVCPDILGSRSRNGVKIHVAGADHRANALSYRRISLSLLGYNTALLWMYLHLSD